MIDEGKRPIVIRRIVKGGGHHGGAWKVAYADFVTAMMAFFLLMWLMGTTSKPQRAAIADYFNNPSAQIGASPTPRPNGMEGPGGASTSPIDLGGGLDQPTVVPPNAPLSDEEAEQQAAEAEQRRMEEVRDQLEQAMAANAALAPYKDQLLIDMTDEGLRLQIVDQESKPMFDVGSAQLLPSSERILREIAKVVAQVPNRIIITGHTDARLYANPSYTNWELSADRANAARRELIRDGLPEAKVAKVVGLASSVLLDPKDPMAPINRRIAIILLKHKADQANTTRAGPAAPGPGGAVGPAQGPTGPAQGAAGHGKGTG
jgi:chemotaxis protein MotB